MKDCPICGAVGNIGTCIHTEQDVDAYNGIRHEIVFDPDGDVAAKCPFHNGDRDLCGIFANFMKNPDARLSCPSNGVLGAAGKAPDACPMRVFEVCIKRKTCGPKKLALRPGMRLMLTIPNESWVHERDLSTVKVQSVGFHKRRDGSVDERLVEVVLVPTPDQAPGSPTGVGIYFDTEQPE